MFPKCWEMSFGKSLSKIRRSCTPPMFFVGPVGILVASHNSKLWGGLPEHSQNCPRNILENSQNISQKIPRNVLASSQNSSRKVPGQIPDISDTLAASWHSDLYLQGKIAMSRSKRVRFPFAKKIRNGTKRACPKFRVYFPDNSQQCPGKFAEQLPQSSQKISKHVLDKSRTCPGIVLDNSQTFLRHVLEHSQKNPGNVPEKFRKCPALVQELSRNIPQLSWRNPDVSHQFAGQIAEMSWNVRGHFPEMSQNWSGVVQNHSGMILDTPQECPGIVQDLSRTSQELFSTGTVLDVSPEMSRNVLAIFPLICWLTSTFPLFSVVIYDFSIFLRLWNDRPRLSIICWYTVKIAIL